VLILGTILGVGQLLVSLFSPELSTFLAGAVALLALYPLSRWKRYGDPVQGIPVRPAMVEKPVNEQSEAAPVMSLSMSFLPYAVLTVVTLGVLLIPQLNAVMRQLQVGLPFPAVETGFGIQNAAVERYAPITVFTHPGMMVLITSVVVWIVYSAGGYYRAWGDRHTPESIWSALLVDAVPASVPVIAFLVTSRILDHSGQILTLAYGIAAISPPLVYAGLASMIGALGAFMTSSSTASCVLFGGVQSSVAQLHGMSTETIIAAQAAGSAYGNAIAPANVVLGTSMAGIKGEEGAVLRITLPWTILVAVLTGIATIALIVFAR
jgi:lactate permease